MRTTLDTLSALVSPGSQPAPVWQGAAALALTGVLGVVVAVAG